MRAWILLAACVVARAQSGCGAATVWSPCDMVFELDAVEAREHPQPWDTVEIRAEIRSPDFKTYLIFAFADSPRRLVLRVTPTMPGEWTFRLTSNLKRLSNAQGQFNATASEDPGFVSPANVHHWKTANNKPHLWIGEKIGPFTDGDRAAFERWADARAAARYTHVAGIVDPKTIAWPPNFAHYQELDHRLAFLNARGIVADLILAPGANALASWLPKWQERERHLRYLVSRYAAYNITWQGVENFEEYRDGRPLLKEIGELLKKLDPYQHPRSTHAKVTSAPLAADGWMDYRVYGTLEPAVGRIEHQLHATPAVYEGAGKDHQALWSALLNGHYPAPAGGDPEAAKRCAEFFEKTRYWELEPWFEVDGGRAIALERVAPEERDGVEYLLFVDTPGPVEIGVARHGYDVRWYAPATGEIVPVKDWKGERFTGEPPNRNTAWVLHLSRDKHKESLKSYKFESRRILQQDAENAPKMLPYDIASPGDAMPLSVPVPFEVKMRRETRATRSMLFLWQGEVVLDGLGYRVLSTERSASVKVPPELIRKSPAVLSLRLYGLNAYGKLYVVDKVVRLTP